MEQVLNFRMSDRLLIGCGATRSLREQLERLHLSRPLIVTDPGIVQAGIVQPIEQELGCGEQLPRFDRVEPDPSLATARNCYDAAREARSDCVVAVGGGSVMDVAKVAAMLVVNGGDPADYVGIDRVPQRGLPSILIPTTSGTGSEVTPIAVLSDPDAKLKKGIVSDHLYATLAIVDPDLTLGLPPLVTAYTGVDALTHAIEAYTNKHSNSFIDAFAYEAIRLIGGNLRQAVRCPDDRAARSAMSRASLFGGMCLGTVNTAAVHALAYPLGGMFNVPHGLANSLLLPFVMRFNLPSCAEKLRAVAVALGEDVVALSEKQAALRAVDAVISLCREVGIVSRMRDLEIPESAIDEMAHAAMQVTRLMNNNPRPVTVDDVRRIYTEAF